MSEKRIPFDKALKVMEEILKGKTAKQAAFDSGVRPQRVWDVKNMFPLFLGLPREYKKHETD